MNRDGEPFNARDGDIGVEGWHFALSAIGAFSTFEGLAPCARQHSRHHASKYFGPEVAMARFSSQRRDFSRHHAIPPRT